MRPVSIKCIYAVLTLLIVGTNAMAKPTCWIDRLNITEIQTEITKLESSFSEPAPKISTWRQLDVSAFSTPEKVFLDRFGEQLAPNAQLDFSSCKHLPCILNTLYQNDRSPNGWIIYWFFLKTGYGIVATENIPRYKSFAGWNYTKFLFSEEELRFLWKVAGHLPNKYFKLKNLASFYRMPPGYIPMANRPNTCAFYSDHEKMIVLSDRCLKSGTEVKSYSKTSTTYVDYRRNAELVIIHELTHAYDSSLKTITHEPKTLENGTSVIHIRSFAFSETSEAWLTLNKSEAGFVTQYARTSPVEDFAETTAYLRIEPEETESKASAKAAFISSTVFDGRKFTRTGLLNYYYDYALAKVKDNAATIEKKCTASDADSTLEKCRLSAAAGYVSLALHELKIQEPEACDVMGSKEIQTIVKTILNKVQNNSAL